MSASRLSIGIVGPGRLGQALGRLLFSLGQPVVAIAGRDSPASFSSTQAAARFIGSGVQAVATRELPGLTSHILVAVPDHALGAVAAELASAPEPITAALHTSGSRGPEALAPLQQRETSCGTLHPLQTISNPEQGAADLRGSYFGITAEGQALDWAREICASAGAHALMIAAESRPLYHAAAVMASNYMVAMIDAAVTLFAQTGGSEEEARTALAPLIRAAVANSLASSPAEALTGPIERGDAQTIAAHLRALGAAEGVPQSVRDLYCSAGLHTVALARRKSPEIDREIIEWLLRGEQEP